MVLSHEPAAMRKAAVEPNFPGAQPVPTKLRLVQSAAELYSSSKISQSSLTNVDLGHPPAHPRLKVAAAPLRPVRRVAALGQELRQLTTTELRQVRSVTSQQMLSQLGSTPSRLLRATNKHLERLHGALAQLDSLPDAEQRAGRTPGGKESRAYAEASDAATALAALLPQMGVGLSGSTAEKEASSQERAAHASHLPATHDALQLTSSSSLPASQMIGSMPVRGVGLSSQMLGAQPPLHPLGPPLRPMTPSAILPTMQANASETLYEKAAALASYGTASHLAVSPVNPGNVRRASGDAAAGDFQGATRAAEAHQIGKLTSASWILDLLSAASSEAHLISQFLGPLATVIMNEPSMRDGLTHVHMMLRTECGGSGMVLTGQGEAQWLPPVPLEAKTIMNRALTSRDAVSCGIARQEPDFSPEHEAPYYGDHSLLIVPLLPSAPTVEDAAPALEDDDAPLGLLILGGTPNMLPAVAPNILAALKTAASIFTLTLARLRAGRELQALSHARDFQQSLLSMGQIEKQSQPKPWASSLNLAVRAAVMTPVQRLMNVQSGISQSTVAAEAAAKGDIATTLALSWAEEILIVLATHFGSDSAVFLRYEPKWLMLCAGDDPTSSFAVRLPLPGTPAVTPGTSAARQVAAVNPKLPNAIVAACTLGAAFSSDGIAAPFFGISGEFLGVFSLSGRLRVRVGAIDPSSIQSAPYAQHEAIQLRAAANELKERMLAETTRAGPPRSLQPTAAALSTAWELKAQKLFHALLTLSDPTQDGGSGIAMSIAIFCAGVLRCSHVTLLQIADPMRAKAFQTSSMDQESGIWGWDGLGRRVLVRFNPHESLAADALAARKATIGTFSAAFGGAIAPRLKEKQVEHVLAVPIADFNGVIQLTRLQPHKVGLSPPAENAFASATAAAASNAALTTAARHEYLGAVLQQKDTSHGAPEATKTLSAPPGATPPPAPPAPPPRVPIRSCQSLIEGIAPIAGAALQRGCRSLPRASEQLHSLQCTLALQLCVARRGGAAVAAASKAPTDEVSAQAGLASAIAATVRLCRGLMSAYGCRLLLGVANEEALTNSFRGAAVARDRGFDDEVVSEPFVKRDISPAQRGVAIAAAFYRKPQHWSKAGGLSRSVAELEATLDGVPGEPAATTKAVLALPLMVGGGEVIGMLVLTNKIPSYSGIRQRSTTTPVAKSRPAGTAATAQMILAQLPQVQASHAVERGGGGTDVPHEPRWLHAGFREAGWFEEPKPSPYKSSRSKSARDEDVADFTEMDVELAQTLLVDVTLGVAHAQLEASAAIARRALDSHSAQNELRLRVGRVFSCAPDAALLARRACRTAALILRAEHVALFRFEASTLALWRCATSSRTELKPCSMRLDPRKPRGVAGTVALTGRPLASDAPHLDPALLPGIDSPEGIALDNFLAVPMLVGPSTNSSVVGVLIALNRRPPVVDSAADGPLAREAAREYAAVELNAEEPQREGSTMWAETRALWELNTMAMIADEASAALAELASQQAEDDNVEEPGEARPILLNALCAAERRLTEAEDRVALVRAAQHL